MKKSTLFLIFIIITICSIASCSAGALATGLFYVSNPKIKTEYTTNNIYVDKNQVSNERLGYVPADISAEQKNDLIDGFNNNFTITYDTQNNAEFIEYFKNYEEIIKINMESNRRALAEIFQTNLPNKAQVIMIDTVSKYEEYAETDWDDDSTYSGLANYQNKIYLFVRKNLILETEDLNDLISHELVHLFQYATEPLYSYNDYPPNWFSEGMADSMKTGSHSYVVFPKESFPANLDALERSFGSNSADLVKLNASYDISTMFYQYLESKYSRNKMIQIMRDIEDYDFNDAFKNQTGVSAENAYINWLNER